MFNYLGNIYGGYSYGAMPPNSMGNFNYPSPYQQMPQGQNVNSQPTSTVQMTSRYTISPVASLEEAKGIQTPMDGSTMFLYNGSTNEVYSKTLAPNGGADFQIYERKKQNPHIEVTTSSEIEQLQKRVTELERIVKDYEQAKPAKKSKGDKDE